MVRHGVAVDAAGIAQTDAAGAYRLNIEAVVTDGADMDIFQLRRGVEKLVAPESGADKDTRPADPRRGIFRIPGLECRAA